VVGDAVVPPAQRAAGRLLDDGLPGVFAGERAYVLQAGEVGDRREAHLAAVVAAQQPGTAKARDLPEMLGDLDRKSVV